MTNTENWPPVNPVGPFDNYCDGIGQPGAAGLGYVSTMKLATGLADVSDYDEDSVLEGIVAYDKAEKANAYIGQINMGTASSFCGTMGRLWGYDLAVAPDLYDNPIPGDYVQYDGTPLPVYNAQPLLQATQQLFGTEADRRFPPAPGAYVVCANKSVTAAYDAANVTSVWCYIAISITRDRNNSADLFIEDAGRFPADAGSNPGDDVGMWLYEHIGKVINSIIACGKDQSVVYEKTFIGWTYVDVTPNMVGTALTCAPYITLAKNAVVGDFDNMRGMPLQTWSDNAGGGVGPS